MTADDEQLQAMTTTGPVLARKAGGAALASLRNRYFLGCTVLLLVLVGAVLVAVGTHRVPRKPPALRIPLSEFKKARLHPYKFLRSEEVASAEMPEFSPKQMGTMDHIRWIVQEPEGPGTEVSFCVAYYAGSLEDLLAPPQQVVPEGTRVSVQREETVPITGRQGTVSVPVQLVVFQEPEGHRRVVLRCFNVNGALCGGLSQASRAIRDSIPRYAYLSRVEVSARVYAQTEDERAAESLRRLLRLVLPALLEDHWPGGG